MKEKRRKVRARLSAPLDVGISQQITLGRTIDISADGMSCEVLDDIANRETVLISFHLGGHSSIITTLAMPVWVRKSGRSTIVGLEFIGISPSDKKAIEEYIGVHWMGEHAFGLS